MIIAEYDTTPWLRTSNERTMTVHSKNGTKANWWRFPASTWNANRAGTSDEHQVMKSGFRHMLKNVISLVFLRMFVTSMLGLL